MATYLEMVNRTLELLRFDAVSAIAGAADPVTLVSNIVNRSARTILEHRIWSFLVRDTIAQFHASATGTSASILSDGSMALPAADLASTSFGDTHTHWYFNAPDDPDFGETFFGIESFRVLGGSYAPTFDVFGVNSPLSADGSANYKLIGNVRSFPDNVRQILSARYQQNPIEVWQDSRADFGAAFPDWHDTEGEPEVIVIGGTVSPTFNTTISGGQPTQTQVFGPRMLLWPVPNIEVFLDLEVVWRHDALSAETDSLSGVPDHICDLIVLRSAVDGLLGQVVADERRGLALAQRYEIELGRAVAQDQSDPMRRRVPTPFGVGSSGSSRARWEKKLITGSWSWP
jgi:hypothetical protein